MEEQQEKISVSHINIRQSISFLLSKLIALEFMATSGVIIFHTILLSIKPVPIENSRDLSFAFSIFIGLVVLKNFLTFWILFQWLNNYYEFSATEIKHRSGILFKKVDKIQISHLGFIEVQQGILGKLFNYGTITLLSQRRYVLMDMYLIHNPVRYANLIHQHAPGVVEKHNLFAETILEKEED